MVRPECEEFTAASWWALIEWLTEQLHRCLGQLRRDRTAFVGKGLFLFHGRAPGLECVGWLHDNPQFRPRAWVCVDLRLGKPVGTSGFGRSVWEREITLEARLPEAHQRKIVQDTDWWRAPRGVPTPEAEDEEIRVPHPFERQRCRVRLAPKALLVQLRAHEHHRLHDNIRGEKWRRPLIPPRVWIDPGRTPRGVTLMALLLILWREGMVTFGPDDSPDAWKWVKGWTRARDDAKCWGIVTKMQRLYIQPQDWRGLRLYLGKVCRGLRVLARVRRTAGEEGRELESAEKKMAQDALRTGGGLSRIETPDDIGEWQRDVPVGPHASVPSGESPIRCPSCDRAELVPPAVCPSCGVGIPETRLYRRKNRKAGEQS